MGILRVKSPSGSRSQPSIFFEGETVSRRSNLAEAVGFQEAKYLDGPAVEQSVTEDVK